MDSGDRKVDPAEIFTSHAEGWYDKSKGYWEKQDRSVNGMLGGFPEVSGTDLLHSRDLVESLIAKQHLGTQRAADVGGGIGRVSYYVLSDFFKEIVIVDPVADFLPIAAGKLGTAVAHQEIVASAQDWAPEGKFDAIWIQWVLMYLTDEDFVSFLRRCREALAPNGLIIVKDNIGSKDKGAQRSKASFYEEDNGICRVYSHYVDLFAQAELTIVESGLQPDWSKELLALHYWVLK